MAECTIKKGDVEVTIKDTNMEGKECVDKAKEIVKDIHEKPEKD